MRSGIGDTSLVQKIFGARLKAARGDKGVSRQEFCDAINTCADRPTRRNKLDELSLERLKKWEYGENPVDLEWLPTICSVLQIDVGYLFGEYEEHTRVISDISAETGLSSDAVTYLQTFKSRPSVISFFDDFIRFCGLHGEMMQKINNAIGSRKKISASSFSSSNYLFMESLKDSFGGTEAGTIKLPPGAVPLDATEASEFYIDYVSRLFRDFLSDYVSRKSKPKGAAENDE